MCGFQGNLYSGAGAGLKTVRGEENGSHLPFTNIIPPKLICPGARSGSRTETYHPGPLGPGEAFGRVGRRNVQGCGDDLCEESTYLQFCASIKHEHLSSDPQLPPKSWVWQPYAPITTQHVNSQDLLASQPSRNYERP